MKRYEFLKVIAKEAKYLVEAAKKLGNDHPDQAVNDVVVHMLDNKTYRTFDTSKGSVRSYVYGAVKNRGLGILRRKVYEEKLFTPLVVAERAQELKTIHDKQHVDPEILKAEEDIQFEQESPDLELATDVRLAVASLPALQSDVAAMVYMGN